MFDNIDSLLKDVGSVDVEEQSMSMPLDLDEVNSESERQAYNITQRLANYFFDERYIKEHPYIPTKISQEVDTLRRLIKMLRINEKAQDTVIQAISLDATKGALYSALTSLQNSMLSMQTQLNNIVKELETIFKEMQDYTEKTFAEKDKEQTDNGDIIVRGSRDFIKDIERQLSGTSQDNTNVSTDV